MMGSLTIWDLADAAGNVGVEDVARVYGVNRKTVEKWLDEKLLPFRQVPSGRKRIIRADDVDWFDQTHMRR